MLGLLVRFRIPKIRTIMTQPLMMSSKPTGMHGNDARPRRGDPAPRRSKAVALKTAAECGTCLKATHGPAADLQRVPGRFPGPGGSGIRARPAAARVAKPRTWIGNFRSRALKKKSGWAVHVQGTALRQGLTLPEPDVDSFHKRWASLSSYAEVVRRPAGRPATLGKGSPTTRPGAAPVVMAGAGPKPDRGRVANPCFTSSYHCCLGMRAYVNEGQAYVDESVAVIMQKVLMRHSDVVDECCTMRSLLAFCRTAAEFRFVDELKWGLSTIPEFTKTLQLFCDRFNRSARVAALTSEGLVDTYINGTDRDIEVLWFYSNHQVCEEGEVFGIHIVPCSHLRSSVMKNHQGVKKYCSIAARYDAYLEEICKAAGEAVLAQSSSIADADSSSSSATESLEAATGPSRPATPPTPGDSKLAIACQTDFPGGDAWTREGIVDHRFETGYDVVKGPDGWVTAGVFAQTGRQHLCRTFTYRGPASHMTGILRRRGNPAYNSQAEVTGFTCHLRDYIEDATAYPDLAWATLSNLQKYGDNTRYYITASTLVRTTVGGVPDLELTRDHTFIHDGVRYGFVRDDFTPCCKTLECYSLKVVSAMTFRKYVKTALRKLTNAVPFLADSWRGVEVRHPGQAASNVLNEALWHLEVQNEADPQNIAILMRARSTALASKVIPPPEMIATALREARRHFGAIPQVGGNFAWGFCYSCGRPRPGKFKGRLCPTCQTTNTAFGRLIADGESVCSDRNPIVYPGLVHKPRQEIPLKAAAETTAVWDENIGVRRSGRALTYDQVAKIPIRVARGPVLGAVGLDGAHVKVSAPGVRSLVNAILYRVFKALPEDRVVHQPAFDKITELARSPLLLGSFLDPTGIPMEVRDWIASINVSRRRRALLRALRLLEERGRYCEDFETVQPFVKSELLAAFSVKSGYLQTYPFAMASVDGAPRPNYPVPEDVPRLIQAPNDETHLVAGPFLKPLVSRLKQVWHKDNWIFYGSVEPTKLNAWLQRIRRCRSYFWSDYTAFDATFSPSTWAMIEGFYRCIYPNAPMDFWRVLEIWRSPKGKVKLRKENVTVWYNAGVCNCSGRDDTALANALFNGLAMAMAFSAAISGKEIEDLTLEDLTAASGLVKISIVGDDSLVGCDFDVQPLSSTIVRHLRQFGLVVKAESSPNLHDVTYLGMMPYPTASGRMYWGPTIGRCLYKLFWMREFGPGVSPPSWTRGIAQSVGQYRQVPIVSDLCQRVDSLLHGHSVLREQVDVENQVWKVRPSGMPNWDHVTVAWLCERYSGLTPMMIDKDLEVIGSIQRLPAVVRLISLEAILRQDDT